MSESSTVAAAAASTTLAKADGVLAALRETYPDVNMTAEVIEGRVVDGFSIEVHGCYGVPLIEVNAPTAQGATELALSEIERACPDWCTSEHTPREGIPCHLADDLEFPGLYPNEGTFRLGFGQVEGEEPGIDLDGHTVSLETASRVAATISRLVASATPAHRDSLRAIAKMLDAINGAAGTGHTLESVAASCALDLSAATQADVDAMAKYIAVELMAS